MVSGSGKKRSRHKSYSSKKKSHATSQSTSGQPAAPATEIYVGGGTTPFQAKRSGIKYDQPPLTLCIGTTSLLLSIIVLMLLILNLTGKLNIDGSDEEKDKSAIQQSARAGAAVLSDANRSLANILQEMRIQQLKLEQLEKEMNEQRKKMTSLESDKIVNQLKIQNIQNDQESQKNRLNSVETDLENLRTGWMDFQPADPQWDPYINPLNGLRGRKKHAKT